MLVRVQHSLTEVQVVVLAEFEGTISARVCSSETCLCVFVRVKREFGLANYEKMRDVLQSIKNAKSARRASSVPSYANRTRAKWKVHIYGRMKQETQRKIATHAKSATCGKSVLLRALRSLLV